MTFTVKVRGASSQPMVCVYTCPLHGEFDAEVQRDETGSAPDVIACGTEITAYPGPDNTANIVRCALPATWTPTPVFGRVKPWEVVRGNWEKPERKTYLDTRKLGEGQSWDEFRKERAKVWEEKRLEDVRKMANE